MLFIGHTRFSLFEPDSGAWHASKGAKFNSVEEYRQYLFSDKRLDSRAEVFIDESLPQLAAGIGQHDVRHVVSYSDSLPSKYQLMLEKAAVQYPFLILDKHVNGRAAFTPSEVAVKAVREFLPERGVFGRYRLDDDDLLPVDYFEQMAPFLVQEHVGWLVSLGKGYTGVRVGSDYYNIREAYYPLLALGLLSICQVSADGKITAPKSVSHSKSDRANPVILDSRSVGYFWAKHAQQDTVLGQGDKMPTDGSEAINRLHDSISHYPAVIEREEVDALFPFLKDKLHIGRSKAQTLELGEGAYRSLDVDDPISLSLPTKQTFLGVTGTLRIDGKPKANNALLSFELVRADSSPLSEADIAALRKAGIYKSGNNDIGFFRYIKTVRGVRSFHYNFELPDGVVCASVSIRKFGDSPSEVKLTELSVY